MRKKDSFLNLIEKELNPKYMNDCFTWNQFKNAVEKHHHKENQISDFKAALIQAFKNEVDQTLSEMEEFRKDSNDIDYNVCQTKVNTLNLMITKINETKPL